MPVIWSLKKWLAVEHDIYRPSELQALLAERVDVHLSLQAISTLINSTPQALRMSTVQALCNALNCKVSDFFDVAPDVMKEQKTRRKAVGDDKTHISGNRLKAGNANTFPDPRRSLRKKDAK